MTYPKSIDELTAWLKEKSRLRLRESGKMVRCTSVERENGWINGVDEDHRIIAIDIHPKTAPLTFDATGFTCQSCGHQARYDYV